MGVAAVLKIFVIGIGLAFIGLLFLLSGRATGTHLWFFDIGQGDAALLQWGEREMIVDGGPDTQLVEKLGSTLSLWDRTIDTMVLTHPDADHLVGLIEVFDRYAIERFITSSWTKASAESRALEQRVQRDTIPTVIQDHSDRVIHLPDGWTALLPAVPMETKELNDRSVVMFLLRPPLRILLMGDAGVDVETALLIHYSDLFPVQLLKVGHHGSCTSSSEAFLKTAAPQFTVISVGKENRYGHPCPKVIERLRNLPTQILRTDELGDIHFEVKNGELRLRSFGQRE